MTIKPETYTLTLDSGVTVTLTNADLDQLRAYFVPVIPLKMQGLVGLPINPTGANPTPTKEPQS